jgi:hypothetical protein
VKQPNVGLWVSILGTMLTAPTIALGSEVMVTTALSVRFLVIFFLCLSTRVFAFDGDPSNAIFVDANTGSDNNPGTMSQPLRTIQMSISAAQSAARARLIVSLGTYNEIIFIPSGISLYGGYDRANDWSYSPQNTTTIDGTVSFEDVSGETHFEGFSVMALPAAIDGGSSYAVQIVDSPGPVFVQYNTLVSGHGANGTDGLSGTNGGAGTNGVAGGDGDMIIKPEESPALAAPRLVSVPAATADLADTLWPPGTAAQRAHQILVPAV